MRPGEAACGAFFPCEGEIVIMGVDRITRLNALLKREIGDSLFRVMCGRDFDLAAVTVTRVSVSRDLREARVFVSIRDHQDDRQQMLAVLNSRRSELQQRINRDITIKYTPRLAFVLDTSIEEGDRVLNLLARLPQENGQNDEA